MYNYSYSADIVCAAVAGELTRHTSRPIRTTAIHTDAVCDGALFVALKGTHSDGHAHIATAISRGASAVFYDPRILSPNDLPEGDYSAIAVEDTQSALGAFAAYHRLQCHCYVIGITGSVGKTTTKQLLYAIFSQVARTVATHENFNNEIGVPLTLLSISPNDAYAIVEMGMSGLGEISYLSRLVQPDIAIITNIGTAHLGKLGSRQKIAQAKSEILDGLRSGGKLIINGDEPLLSHLPNAITVSTNSDLADYRISNYAALGNVSSFEVTHDHTRTFCSLFTVGKHCAFDAALAFAGAKEAGICTRAITEGLRHYQPCALRQSLRPFGPYLLFEDCYNASYESMRAALHTFCSYAKQQNRRAVAILGDMLELGDDSPAWHRKIGHFAAQCGVTTLFAFGTFANDYADGFLQSDPSNKCLVFPSIDYPQQSALIERELKENDVLLLKGSRALHLEQLLPYLENKK